MKTFSVTCLVFVCFVQVAAQQLLLEGFGSWNKTNYSGGDFANASKFLGYGGRLALGADHFQIGAEYRGNLTDPSFSNGFIERCFKEDFLGGFLRTKISRYPAMRFGLVLRAGAGMYRSTAVTKTNQIELKDKYDPILGFNGGFGFSIPLFDHTMLELGYTYNHLERPKLETNLTVLEKHNGSYHMITAGLSLNFVFGKRAESYQHVRENWKFRNGWRG